MKIVAGLWLGGVLRELAIRLALLLLVLLTMVISGMLALLAIPVIG